MDAAWEHRSVDPGLEVVKWVGEAVAATLVGSAATWFTTLRSSRAVLEKLADRVAELQAKVEELESAETNMRVQSGVDHANAANLAVQVVEVKALSAATNATMQRILGLLDGKGIGGPFR